MPAIGRPGLDRVNPPAQSNRFPAGVRGFTLIELVVAVAIVALIYGGVFRAYIQSGQRIQWTGYSLAAESLANQTIDQARAATWDPTMISSNTPYGMNQLTNMNLLNASYSSSSQTYTGYTIGTLDVPVAGTNVVPATNFVTIQMFNVNSNASITAEFVRVDTVWPFGLQGRNVLCTNTVCTIIAPDNASSSSF